MAKSADRRTALARVSDSVGETVQEITEQHDTPIKRRQTYKDGLIVAWCVCMAPLMMIGIPAWFGILPIFAFPFALPFIVILVYLAEKNRRISRQQLEASIEGLPRSQRRKLERQFAKAERSFQKRKQNDIFDKSTSVLVWELILLFTITFIAIVFASNRPTLTPREHLGVVHGTFLEQKLAPRSRGRVRNRPSYWYLLVKTHHGQELSLELNNRYWNRMQVLKKGETVTVLKRGEAAVEVQTKDGLLLSYKEFQDEEIFNYWLGCSFFVLIVFGFAAWVIGRRFVPIQQKLPSSSTA